MMIVFTKYLVEFILFFKDCDLSLKLRGKYCSIIYSKFTKTPKTASAPTSEGSLRAQFRHFGSSDFQSPQPSGNRGGLQTRQTRETVLERK